MKHKAVYTYMYRFIEILILILNFIPTSSNDKYILCNQILKILVLQIFAARGNEQIFHKWKFEESRSGDLED